MLVEEKVEFLTSVSVIRWYPAGNPSLRPPAVARAAGACPEGKDAGPEAEKDRNGWGTVKGELRKEGYR